MSNLDRNESLQLRRLIQASRPTTRHSMLMAAFFAAQVTTSAVLLLVGYAYFHAKPVGWAIVSAILVFQPGVEQSLGASAVRIAANGVGGITGVLFGRLLGEGNVPILLSLVFVVFACELLRLDLGLRTACVSVVIVMFNADGRIVTTAMERLSAVVVGCVTALIVQTAAEFFRRRIGFKEAEVHAEVTTAKTVRTDQQE